MKADIVEIKGVKYKLVPIEEEKTQENRPSEVDEAKKTSILEGYGEKPDESVAKPGVFNAKKRLDEKRATLSKNAILENIPQQDAELSKFGNLVIGEGLTQIF